MGLLQDIFQHGDTVGLLVHKYLTANGYGDCAKQLAVTLNLDLDSDLKGLSLDSVYQNFQKKASESDLVGTLVYRYLKESGHDDLAKKLAQKLRLDLKVDLDGWSLQDIYQQYPKSSPNESQKVVKPRSDIILAKEDLMTSPNPDISTHESFNGTTIFIVYQEHEYTTYGQRMEKNGNVHWRCRVAKCTGRLTVHWASGSIVNAVEHSHMPRPCKEESTMGTGDTTLRYSLSKMKSPVLHYRGYEYLRKNQPTRNGKIYWICRLRSTRLTHKPCPGFLYTSNGQVVGKVREHNHLPTDGNRMLTPMFL